MTAHSDCHHAASAHCSSGLLGLINAGLVTRLSKFVVEDVEINGEVHTQTVAIVALSLDQGGVYPIVMIDHHDSDDLAMQFSVMAFDALKRAGHATSDQVAKWRRGLFTAVS
ncbi:hypothetical protein [Pseudomonas aeruginosa]|uniref:hypothetical protein n=1 Tax=Pseudomonas aeruginosa TaxID=287 RepID=UPI002E28B371|nr:hypothetical protein [Pseudomonas aeruginosa]